MESSWQNLRSRSVWWIMDLGSWTAEQGIAFEAAEWVLGSLIGWCAEQSTVERVRRRVDPARLAELAAERAGYAAVCRSLDVHDPEQVRRVPAEYGPLARQRYSARPYSPSVFQGPS
jgi:hypothetical protein